MTPRQPGSTLRQVVNYHAYDDSWVPDTLAGKTIDEVGSAHDGDLLGDDPKASFARIVATAVDAVRAFTDLDRTVHLTYGDWPAREYLTHITHFRASRVYDLSAFIRQRIRQCPPTWCRGSGTSWCPAPRSGAGST